MKEFTYRRILQITAPLMFGTFVQSIVTFTDAIFVSELGDVAIGAFGNGSLVYVSLFMFCRGLSDGTQITIARQNGEGRTGEIGGTLFNAQIFQLLLSTTLFAALFIFGELVIIALSESKDVAQAMIDFVKVRGWGLFFAAQQMTLVGFFIGLGRTRIILFSALIIALCNIVLDYGLISGNMGLPKLGLIGAPLASSTAEFVGFIFLLIYLLRSKSFKEYAYTKLRSKLNLKEHFELIKLSFPLMLQGVFSLSTWLVFFTLVEHMGTASLEAAHNIRYMYFLAFVPLFGFAASTKTIVSTLVGQKKEKDIAKVQGRIILLSVLFSIIFFHGALLYPDKLIYLVDRNPVIAPEVLSNSIYILQFISGSIFIFSIAVVFYNSVAGLGKTTVSFAIEIIAIIAYLIGCYFFIIKWKWSIRDVWWIEYIYFSALGVFSLIYLLYYRQKYILNEQ